MFFQDDELMLEAEDQCHTCRHALQQQGFCPLLESLLDGHTTFSKDGMIVENCKNYIHFLKVIQ